MSNHNPVVLVPLSSEQITFIALGLEEVADSITNKLPNFDPLEQPGLIQVATENRVLARYLESYMPYKHQFWLTASFRTGLEVVLVGCVILLSILLTY